MKRLPILALVCSAGVFVNPVPIGAGERGVTGPGSQPQPSICARFNGDGTVDLAPGYSCMAWDVTEEQGGWLMVPSPLSTGRNVSAVRVRPPRYRPCPDPRDRPPCDVPTDDDDDMDDDDDEEPPPPGEPTDHLRFSSTYSIKRAGTQPVRVPVQFDGLGRVVMTRAVLMIGGLIVDADEWAPTLGAHTYELTPAFWQRCPCTVRLHVTLSNGQPLSFNVAVVE